MAAQMIHMQEVELAYPGQSRVVLKNLNLSVKQGERIVLLGENGAGKTLLLKTLAGLFKPRKGEILFKQKAMEQWSSKELAAQLAFVGNRQEYNHLLTVREFIAFGRYPFINWLGKLGQEDLQLIDELGAACGIEHLYDKTISEVSDGEKQKVVIARALVQQTEILLLDEPSSHLDLKNALTILKLLKEQSERHQKTLIFSSHQIEVALNIADRIWLCNKQELIESTVEEFKADAALQKKVFGDFYRFEKGTDSFKIQL